MVISFSDNDIKLIAIITMVIDHIGVMYFPDLIILRLIGRIAFPLFVFMIVKGYFRTKNFNRYCLRILVLALISEVPFDLFNSGNVFDLGSQNVCFTLLLCLVFIRTYHINKEKSIRIMSILGFSLISIALRVDYLFLGILYSVVFYYSITTNLTPYKQGLLFVVYSLLYSLVLIIQPIAVISLFFTINYEHKEINKESRLSFFLNKYKKYYYISYPVQFLILIIINVLIKI